ncbi:6268_t:CDS:10, partial [Acaulospora morrowiae]
HNNQAFPWSQRKINSSTNIFPRHGHSTSQYAINNEIFIFGGIFRGQPRNDLYVMETNTLNAIAFMATGDIPPPRSLHTHVHIGNNMIVFGGLPATSEERLDENIYVLNTVSKNWTRYPISSNPKRGGRFGHTATVIGSKMYIFGGKVNGYCLNDLMAFDIKSLNSYGPRWEIIVPQNESPPERYGHIACACNDKIYIFGGSNGDIFYNDTWCYDIPSNTWTRLQCTGYIPVPRHEHGAINVDDMIYIFGGINEEGQELGDLTAFGLSNQRWYIFQKMILPNPRFRHTLSSARERILMFGGDSMLPSKPDDDGTISMLDTSKIKYPPANQTPGRVPQQTQQKPQSPSRSVPQQFQNNGYTSPTPYSRQQSSPTSQFNNSSFDVNRSKQSVPAIKQNSMTPNGQLAYEDDALYRRQPTSGSEDFRGFGASSDNSGMGFPRPIQDYNQASSPRVMPETPDTIGPQGSPPYGMNNNQLAENSTPENIRGNPPEQLRHMERDAADSPQQTSYSFTQKSSIDNLRENTPSPSSNRPIRTQQSLDQLREVEDPRARAFGQMEKKPIVPMQMGVVGDFTNPRQAPKPPITNNFNNSSGSSASPVNQDIQQNFNNNNIVQNTDKAPLMINTSQLPYGDGATSPPSSAMSSNSHSSQSFDTIDHFPAPVSNVDRDKLIREIQQRDIQIAKFKKRETWLKAELSLARQAGYVPEPDRSSNIPEGIDLEKYMDIGENGSDKQKVMLAVVQLKHELRKAKAMIASQAQSASQKITDAERARTAALQEAAYFKAKLTALTNASETELASIEVARAADLEKRLTQALTEKELLQTKLIQYQQSSTHDKSSRETAEERAKTATARAEEAEEAHARALAELATLHSRATAAESQLRENNVKMVEISSELAQFKSGSEGSRSQIVKLQQSLEQHQRALEKANEALNAANERTVDAEALWREARQDIVALEKEEAALRTELDLKMRDLERAQSRAKELERLLGKAQKEADSVRAMMQEGMTELLNTSRNEGGSSEAAEKIAQLEQEIAALKSSQAESQKVAQEASNSYADAMIKISQMEGAAMKVRSDTAALQRRLIEASDDTARTKERLREKERLLEEKTRALENAEVKIGMMREVMSDKGILEDSGKSSRIKELESRCVELESIHNQAKNQLKTSNQRYQDALRKVKDAESKNKVLEEELGRTSNNNPGSIHTTPDITISGNDYDEDQRIAEQKAKELEEVRARLHQVEKDYQTAVHYVKGTEKMLRRMKEELTKSKKDVVKLTEKLTIAQERNEQLEESLAEAENNNSVRNGYRESQLQEYANQQLEEQRVKFAEEKEQLEQQIEELKRQLERAQEEKNMVDQEYDVLRKEYETLRKESDSLRKLEIQLKERLQNSEEALKNTRLELEQTVALYNQDGSTGVGIIDRKKWDEQRAVLDRELAEYRTANDKLEKENNELEQKLKESENKITILLDQMEHAVDTYREIEVDIRDSSPRSSNDISSLTNELDMLKSQWGISHQESNLSGGEFIDSRWSRLPGGKNEDSQTPPGMEEFDEMMAALDEVQKVAAQRNIGQFETVEDII